MTMMMTIMMMEDDEDWNRHFKCTVANMYKATGSQTVIDGVPHSLHFQFTARCNRRCLLNAIVTPV